MPRKSSSYDDTLLQALSDPTEAAAYLDAAFEDSQDALLMALREIAMANQMSKVAKDAGIKRESLYRSLSEQGNPTLETFLGILNAVGIKLRFTNATEPKSSEQESLPELQTKILHSVQAVSSTSTFFLFEKETFGPLKTTIPSFTQTLERPLEKTLVQTRNQGGTDGYIN